MRILLIVIILFTVLNASQYDIAVEEIEAGNDRKAEEILKALAEREPEIAKYYRVLGHILLKRKMFHEAEKYYSKAYDLKDENALEGLAMTLLAQGKVKELVNLRENLLSIEVKSNSTICILCGISQELNDVKFFKRILSKISKDQVVDSSVAICIARISVHFAKHEVNDDSK
jgi:tetratricopeptide (TPR) repeat protein